MTKCRLNIKSEKHRQKVIDILDAISQQSYFISSELKSCDDRSFLVNTFNNNIDDLNKTIDKYYELTKQKMKEGVI